MITQYILFVTFGSAAAFAFKVDVTNELQMPSRSDFETFLVNLKNIVDYGEAHIDEVETNFMFGIFLTKVNLVKHFNKKIRMLSWLETGLMEAILKGCDSLLETYRRGVMLRHAPSSREELLSSLFGDDTGWAAALPPFASCRPAAAAAPDGAAPPAWPSWDTYQTMLVDYEAGVPTPYLSDECLTMLGRSGAREGTARACSWGAACRRAARGGSRAGYALTHRILLVASGALGSRCHVDSAPEDAALLLRLCAAAHAEATYIAAHGYRARDIFMEQISVCSLVGRAEFLQRPWLRRVVSWRLPAGCYHQPSVETHDINKEGLQTKVMEGEGMSSRTGREMVNETKGKETIEGECNDHVTAVAAAVLSAAVRYILECEIE